MKTTDFKTGHLWLTPVILATQEAESRRTVVQSQSAHIVPKTLSRKNPSQERVGGVAQGVGPEFKSQNYKKKKTPKNRIQHHCCLLSS
jgi:hypothetical protein